MLIRGETGTGKELLARYHPRARARARGRPFVERQLRALPEQLLESELFGHEKGAFTGAKRPSKGLFELADGGTLFLDEIGELPPALQAKLLRVLETRDVPARRRHRRHHGRRARGRRDATATSRSWSRDGRVPRGPLLPAQRGADRDAAAARARARTSRCSPSHFIAASARELGRPPRPDLPARRCARCARYRWPGNVRELQNVVERVVLLEAEDES